MEGRETSQTREETKHKQTRRKGRERQTSKQEQHKEKGRIKYRERKNKEDNGKIEKGKEINMSEKDQNKRKITRNEVK